MKLYLTSMPLTTKTELLKLFPSPDNLSVVVIPTAWDTRPNERKEMEVQNCLTAFQDYGFKTSLLDLVDTTEERIKETLASVDLVWVMGGNTFYLNYYMAKSGFGKIIKSLLKKGLVYGGESAGAVIVGRTLHGIECLDDPKEAPETIWEGLGILDFSVLPHWGWEAYGESLKEARTEMENFTKVLVINNDEAIVIDGEEMESVRNPSGKKDS